MSRLFVHKMPYFSDFSTQKLGVYIIYKNYKINFFSGHMPLNSRDGMLYL